MPEEKKPTEKHAEDAQEQEKTEGKETPAEEEKPTEEAEGTENKPAEKTRPEPAPKDSAQEETSEEQGAPPEMSEIDKLKEENFRLRTQLEANTLGFTPDVIEDAVILAENIVKRDGSDISAALKAVAKKYPAWLLSAQDEKQKGGFKVGADSSGGKSADDDEKLNQIFGIRKKK